jgi:alcohol dehydrogenase class IV
MVIQDKASHDAGLTKKLKQAFSGTGMTMGISGPAPEDPDSQAAAMFVRSLYDCFQEKGYDALVALGGKAAAQAAKALNIAVSLGPEALTSKEIFQPLAPLVFLPTGTDAYDGTTRVTQFNGHPLSSPHLSPDLVMIDPRLMLTDDRNLLLDRALTCLAAGCEIFALSPAPPARAYAATIVCLARSALASLLASGLKGPDNLKAAARENARIHNTLVQASVMTGYLMSQDAPIVSLALGRAIAGRGRAPLGQIMVIVLPAVLESRPSTALGDLYLHLSTPDAFASVPASQQPLAAVYEIRNITHTLFSLSHGLLPRTLGEAGWSMDALESLRDDIKNAFGLTDPKTLTRIMARALDGRPMGN